MHEVVGTLGLDPQTERDLAEFHALQVEAECGAAIGSRLRQALPHAGQDASPTLSFIGRTARSTGVIGALGWLLESSLATSNLVDDRMVGDLPQVAGAVVHLEPLGAYPRQDLGGRALHDVVGHGSEVMRTHLVDARRQDTVDPLKLLVIGLTRGREASHQGAPIIRGAVRGWRHAGSQAHDEAVLLTRGEKNRGGEEVTPRRRLVHR